MELPDSELVLQTAARLNLQSRGRASETELAELEALAGAKLPSIVLEFLRACNGCSNTDVRFDGDTVLFYSVSAMLREITAQDIEGMGGVPFAHDFTSCLWFVMMRPDVAGSPAGRVDYIPLPEYTDPANPIEHRAADFASFLRGLTLRTHAG